MAEPVPAAAKPSILVQLDVDPQPSVFDGVVAVDSGRRPPVPPRRGRAGLGPRPGLRRPVHQRAGRPEAIGPLRRRLGRGGGRGGPRGGQGVLLRARSGSRSSSTPTARTRRPPPPSWRPWRGRAGPSKGSRPPCWPGPGRSASESPASWAGSGPRSPSARDRSPRPGPPRTRSGRSPGGPSPRSRALGRIRPARRAGRDLGRGRRRGLRASRSCRSRPSGGCPT